MAEQQRYPDPDLVLIAELLEEIDRHPPAHQARSLLMQHYKRCGWHDQAEQEALQIIAIDPSDLEARKILQETPNQTVGAADAAKLTTEASSESPGWRPKITSIQNTADALQDLSKSYTLLISKAGSLMRDMNLLQQLGGPDLPEAKMGLTAITTGQMIEFVRPKPVEGVSAVAATIIADARRGSDAALDTMLKHLEGLARRLNSAQQGLVASVDSTDRSDGSGYADAVRVSLVERTSALKTLLPRSLLPVIDSAMMHADHEILKRKYVNDTTMLFDPIS